MENKLEIESNQCVNSNWKAQFLCTEHEECCQCSFGECKVRVAITYNGHKPYTYILTEDEIESARRVISGTEIAIPEMLGVQEALDKLTIRPIKEELLELEKGV